MTVDCFVFALIQDTKTYGGSFCYHLADDHLVAVGYVIGLDYHNPYIHPFKTFQQFKTHPKIKPLFEGATRIGYVCVQYFYEYFVKLPCDMGE